MQRKWMSMLLLAGLAAFAVAPNPVQAQPGATPSLMQPVVDAPLELAGDHATTWTEGSTRYLLLEGDVRFALGVYAFQAKRALVRIDREQKPGRVIRHAAAFLEQATSVPGGGSIDAEAPRLLVTGATSGDVELHTNLMDRAERAPGDDLVTAGQARIERWIAAMSRPTQPVPDTPLYGPETDARRSARREQIERGQIARRLEELRQTQRESARDDEAEALAAAQQRVDEQTAREERSQAGGAPPAATGAAAPTDATRAAQTPEVAAGPVEAPIRTVLPTSGRVAFTADRVVTQPAEGETAVLLIGDVKLIYLDEQGDTAMTLQAERVVLFVDGDLASNVGAGELAAGDVTGVYLEDNVIATDGRYTVRAPRMFYDLAGNRAVLLEAVLYTWDARRQIPIYVRADTMRQTSARSFAAEDALLTTSEFAEPHVALGAGRVVVEQTPGEGEALVTRFRATNNTVRLGGVPVMYWPVLAGRDSDIPLRSASAGYSSDDGPELLTAWDAFGLIGREQPEDGDLTLHLDYRGDHGPGVGLDFEYATPDMFGEATGYVLPIDDDDDELGGGRRPIEHDDDIRGLARWEHRQELRYDIELSLEAAYVSDETFLETFFEEEAYEARPYQTSAYLKKDDENWAVSVLASTNVNDFTPQLTTLQAPGYAVEKLPELSWWVTGDSLWDDRLTWYNQTTVTRARLLFGDDSPDDRGFTDAQSLAIFGIPDAGTSFETAFESAGFPSGDTLRFDSRQEIVAPMVFGPVNVSPFVVGRLTAYDRDFDAFSDDAQDVRLWGQAGVRASTQFHKTYDAQSKLLNLHGLRHIIEPSVQVSWAGTSVEGDALPVYDFYTEHLQEGGAVTLGLTQTFETLRGGEGRWRNVEWITLDMRYTIADDELDEDRMPRYYWYRPEYALGGDHFYTQLMWMVSESVAMAGELTYDVDDDQVAQWRVNAQFDHTPRLSSVVGYEDSDIVGSQTISYGLQYQLTTKYRVGVAQTLDLEEDDSRAVSFNLTRKLPRWTLNVFGTWDEVDDETTVGITLLPQGLSGTNMLFR